MINIISSLIIPIVILLVIIYGFIKRIDIYDAFISGAKESFDMIFSIFPSLIGMILAINVFINSGLLTKLLSSMSGFFDLVKFPLEVVPLALMRPISGSSALALLNNIFASFGPDSFIGTLASVIQGSTDTTFYVITLYFGTVGIKKIRYSLFVGLLTDLIGIVVSVIIVNLMFSS